MNIRGKTISFSSRKKRENVEKEMALEEKIKVIEEIIHTDFTSLDEEHIHALNDHKAELETLRNNKIKGSIIRAKAQWLDAGEKPSKYFLNMENRNYTSKLIPKIILESGEEVLEQNNILKEQ